MKTLNWLILVLLTVVTGPTLADAVFGRLYTTPKQREQLDEARNRKPQAGIVVITEQTPDLTPSIEAAPGVGQSITLDGIVYRSDGKNTAWVNRNSTNEGHLETLFTKVSEKDVRSNQVKITLPDNQTRIDLKVGQQYDVDSKEVRDMMKDPAGSSTSGQPEPRR